MSSITRTRRYPVSPAALWPLVATAEGLSAWLMPTDLVAEVGRRFTMTTDPAPGFDGVVRGEVLVVDPPRQLVVTWVGGPIDTTVTFSLVPEDGGTVLRVEQRGFTGLRGALVRPLLSLGWRSLLAHRLPDALATRTHGEV